MEFCKQFIYKLVKNRRTLDIPKRKWQSLHKKWAIVSCFGGEAVGGKTLDDVTLVGNEMSFNLVFHSLLFTKGIVGIKKESNGTYRNKCL